MNVGLTVWCKFECPECDVPSVLYEDLQPKREFYAHGEMDVFCWLPEWELRWGRPELLEVIAQHHGKHATFRESRQLLPIA